MRVLGVDHGAARTGLALSDPLGFTCRPLHVLHERDQAALIRKVVEAALEEDAGEIVVGLPRPLSGGRNRQLDEAEAFARHLAEESPVPVSTWDERFTTKLAERGRRGGAPADSVAACHLLQNFLDARHLTRERQDAEGEVEPG